MQRILLLAAFIASTFSLFAQEPVKWEKEYDPEIYEDSRTRRSISPGIGYGAFMTNNWENSGIFHGINTELTLFSIKKEKKEEGPGYARMYARFNMMKSTETNTGLFIYGIGANMSFEKNAVRKAMIPYFGIELGGMNRSDINKAAFQFTPLLGVNLLSLPNFNWYLQGGYTYAASRNFNEMSGVFAGTGLTVSFW